MKLILHIGMGKTGTSSIQNALRTSSAELAEQKVRYLGMWFDAIDPKFNGHAGLQQFLDSGEQSLQLAAQAFSAYLRDQRVKNGAETFILSNEGLFGPVERISPFLKALRNDVDLELIAYVRDPAKWLPSAFIQWGIYHKQHKGPLQSFPQRARTLIGQYNGIIGWVEEFSDNLIVRKHDTSIDVVKDFASACSISIPDIHERALERSEPAQILLRAAFNNRYDQEVFPERFNNLVLPPKRNVAALKDLAELCFRQDETKQIIEEKMPVFEFMRDKLGSDFDFLSSTTGDAKSMPDPEQLQARLIDHLVEITFLQSERIKRLENQMLELRKDQ